jgi:carotenoid cleavage dioxygenase-like enzyme
MIAMLQAAPFNYPEAKYDPATQESLGNTALTVHQGRMLALNETGYPISLRVSPDGAVTTGDVERFGGKLNKPFSAHPKRDPRTGELVSFGYECAPCPLPVLPFPIPPIESTTNMYQIHSLSQSFACLGLKKGTWHWLTLRRINGLNDKADIHYFCVSPKGELSAAIPVDASHAQLMHDFGITETYAVFIDQNLILKTNVSSPAPSAVIHLFLACQLMLWIGTLVY